MIVTIVYTEPGVQHLLQTEVPAGSTVEQAIFASGLLARVPGLQVAEGGVGIWNRPVELSFVVREGDRIEVYRPLQVDPKDARRRRAEIRRRRGPARKV